MSNITSSNDSDTSTTNRWGSDTQNQPVTFTISGGELANANAVFSGQKQAVLAIPSELRGNVAPNGQASINTNITLDLTEVTLLTDVLNAANSLTDVVTQITSGLLGDLTGVDIDLTEVTNQLNLLNNLQSLGGANFTSDQTLSADGSYISADVSDGLGLVLAQNVSTILRDLQSAISSLEASGSGIASNVVATAINAALTPVKGTLNTAINVALPLLNAGGSLVNQLLDASVLGSTTVTLPTTVSAPQNLTQNLDARFVGSVIQANAVDVNLISTGNGASTIYFAPADSSAVTAPNITNVTGTSADGYTVTGTADPNVTVEIRNQSGTTIATATTDDTGAFTANIPAGQATAEESLTAVAINNGTESPETSFETPVDPTATVATPTVDNVTGNSTAGYTVTGTAENGTTIEVRNADGTCNWYRNN